MLKAVSIILVLGIVCSVKEVQGVNLSEQQCTSGDFRFFTDCFNSLGFSSSASLAPNVTALMLYCSTPGRTKGKHCVNDFRETCPLAFLGSDASTFLRRRRLASKSLDYVCSYIGVLENDIDCVEGQMTELRQCVENGLLHYAGELASVDVNVTMEYLRNIMKSAGEITERCFVDILGENCSSAVSQLMGNFLHGMLVYSYES